MPSPSCAQSQIVCKNNVLDHSENFKGKEKSNFSINGCQPPTKQLIYRRGKTKNEKHTGTINPKEKVGWKIISKVFFKKNVREDLKDDIHRKI